MHQQVAMEEVKAELLTIGDEILYGQIVDTNSQWMSVELSNAGIKVIRKSTVGDIEEDILTAFAEAERRADIILITGGLGPTSDDLTKPCLAKYFGCEMRMHEEALSEVTEFFKSRGRELTEVNRQQAVLPVCCQKITNRMGTAPGMWFERNNKVFVSMPGVPHEMKRMMTDLIIPKLTQTFRTPVIQHTVIRTVGIGESVLAEKISSWEKSLPPHFKLAYLPNLSEVKLRLTAIGNDKDQLQRESNTLVNNLKPLAGEYIFGIGDDPLEMVLGKLLRDKNLTLAVAESCTGGFVSHLLTTVPGSSDYLKGSVVAYSNEIKISLLNVADETIKRSGAVSEQTAREMAKGIRERFQTSIGISTTGIAGPTGGTEEKPVGTVWIGYSDNEKTIARKIQLSKDRIINIRASAVAALNLLRLNMP